MSADECSDKHDEADRLVSITVGGSTHVRTAGEWLALARASLSHVGEGLRPCGCTLGKDGRQVDECAFHLGEKLARAERLAPSATQLDKAAVLKAIDDESELPGDMPDDMWSEILRMVVQLDRDGLIEAFRITVRQTKQGIRDRLCAATESKARTE
jgi:hypothetical protein